jgi:hypothetical protein
MEKGGEASITTAPHWFPKPSMMEIAQPQAHLAPNTMRGKAN